MKLFTKVMTILLVLSLNACISTGIKKIQAIKGTQKVLVVSSMGDDYEMLHIGVTIFSNKFKTLNVEGWNIDSIIESKVARLNIIDKFDFANLNLTPLKNNMKKLSKSFWTDGVVFNGFDKKIFPFARDNNFDLVLFINSYTAQDPVFFTGLQVNGYGLYKRKVFGKPSAKYYALVSTSLYDVETRKKIAGSSISKSEFTNNYHTTKGVDSITLEKVSKDKDIILNLIMESVSDQLKILGITKNN